MTVFGPYEDRDFSDFNHYYDEEGDVDDFEDMGEDFEDEWPLDDGPELEDLIDDFDE